MPGPRDRVRYWQAPVLGGVECLIADYRRQKFPRHFHDSYSMGLVTRGANVFSYRRGVVEAPAGTICVAEPGEVHDGGRAPGGWAYFNLHIPAATMAGLAVQAGCGGSGLPGFATGMLEDPALCRAYLAMFRALRDASAPLEQESLMTLALADMLRRHGASARAAPMVRADNGLARAIRDFLQDHWQDKVRLADLEQATGAGRYRLLRAFRRATGLTPHAYQLQIRVARAKGMLLAGGPIADVAVATGFSDQAHLSRVFRGILGVTPGMVAAAA